MTASAVEHVLVVPTEMFHSLGYFQGFSGDTERYLEQLLSPAHTSYRPRPEMESDPSFKQLIPYVVFRYCDSAGNDHVFQYTRGKGQGEKRLHSKRSVGIGGHICREDDSATETYFVGMHRELQEEVIIESRYSQRCVGLINDDLTEVGKVHLGVVHVFDVEEPRVRAKEDDIANAGFAPVTQLIQELDQFETWSSICLKALFT